MAPALLAWELGNVIHGRKRSSFGATVKARVGLLENLLEAIQLEAPSSSYLEHVAELVAGFGLPFYDAGYLALAEAPADSVLITHDAALLEAATKRLGPHRALDSEEAVKRLVSSS